MPTLLCACTLALIVCEAMFAFDAVGQSTTSGGPPTGGPPADATRSIGPFPATGQDPGEATRSIGPLPATGQDPGEATRSIGPLPATGQDPAERSARSIECAQKADAQGLEGKTRKHFLHHCRSGI
jgi:hypothetical protein